MVIGREFVKNYLEENGFFESISEEQKEQMVEYHYNSIACKGSTTILCNDKVVVDNIVTHSIVHDICFGDNSLYTADKLDVGLEKDKLYTIITKVKNWTTIVENVKFIREEYMGKKVMFGGYCYTFRNKNEISDENGRQ